MMAETAKTDTCTFTWDQLYELLFETLERFQAYRDQYDCDEEQAKHHTVLATLESLRLDCPLYSFFLD